MAISENVYIEELIHQLQDKVIELQEIQKQENGNKEYIQIEWSRLTLEEFLQENFKNPANTIPLTKEEVGKSD